MSICPIFHMMDKPWTNFCPIYDQDLSFSALTWKLLACPIFVKILSVSRVCINLVKQIFLFGFYLYNPCQCPEFVTKTSMSTQPQIEIQGSAKLPLLLEFCFCCCLPLLPELAAAFLQPQPGKGNLTEPCTQYLCNTAVTFSSFFSFQLSL